MEAKLRKQLRAKKAVLTRSLTELDTLITERRNQEEVKIFLENLKQKKATLTESYEKLLVEVSEETLETEIESMAQFEALETSSLGRAQSYLRNSRVPNSVLPNLEPVKMLPFDGDPCAYPEFITAFKVIVDNNPNMTSMEKMLRLKDKLRGAALSAVGGLAFTDADYASALSILESRFGGRDRLIQDSLKRLRALQTLPSSGSPQGLREFADTVTSSLNKLRNIGDTNNIHSDTLIREVVAKLPTKERDAVFEMCVSSGQALNLETLEPWLQRRAEICMLSAEYTKSEAVVQNDEAIGRTSQSSRNRTFSVKSGVTCTVCKNGEHQLDKCRVFLRKDVNGRWTIVKEEKRCFTCLKRSHRSADCRQTRRCGCGRSHHYLLCTEHQTGDDAAPPRTTAGTMGGVQGGASNAVALRTLPVKIKYQDREMVVNAFLDGGSDTTYLSEDTARALGISWNPRRIQITTLGGNVLQQSTTEVKLEVGPVGQRDFTGTIQAWTIPVVCGGMKVTDWATEKSRWNHLSQVDFMDPQSPNVVDLLIGSDYPELHHVLERRSGPSQSPVAELTPLGWVCVGPVGTNDLSERMTARASAVKESPENLLRRFWEIDEAAIIGSGTGAGEAKALASEERDAENKANQSLSFMEGRYEIGIPWRGDGPTLPDNKRAALARLGSLERNLKKSPSMAEKYKEKMKENLEKGYVRLVEEDSDEEGSPAWYLPHFPVVREDKQTTKVRIVMDSAAQFAGNSLNSEMLSGPKLQNDMVDLLIRFRSHPVALVGASLSCGQGARASRKKRAVARRETKRLIYKLKVLGQPVTSEVRSNENPITMEAKFASRTRYDSF